MGCLRLPTLALTACLHLTCAAWSDGETELPGELRGKTFLEMEKAAADFVAKQQWSEAVTEYQRLMDEMGDRLILPAPKQSTAVHVRRLCQARLAALPPDALKLYRSRVDAQAKKWLDQGLARRDPALLQRVANEAFCSSSGAEAVELLGDLAFEQGRFDDAERWWNMLLPVPPDRKPGPTNFDLIYADPPMDLAPIRAKVLLSRLFRKDYSNWDAALDAFRKLHPKAEGSLAGQKGNFADLLQSLFKPDPFGVPEIDSWLTFGGDGSRNLVLPRDRRDPNRLTRLCQFPPWRFDLERRARIDEDNTVPRVVKPGTPLSTIARTLAFHPVIVNGQALVADARYVTAYDLGNGKAVPWFDLRNKSKTPEPNLKLPAQADLRYTLTVAGDRVFARLGAQAIADVSEREREAGAHDSFLVCLDLTPDREEERFRWMVHPDPTKKETVFFEGAPVVREGQAYIATTRFTVDQAITAIHCYSVDTKGTPTPRWKQEVCAVPKPKLPRYQHHLLTLAGPNVVFCTHSGAIVAVNAATGRQVWAFRYTPRDLALAGGGASPRDLAPCVYADGRLLVAPADSDRLFCLDPSTGQLLWQREEIEVVHALGAAKGRWIFTTAKGIRAIYVIDGRDVPGWKQPSVGDKPSFGRGILAGDLVYWPTADNTGLYVLGQHDGSSQPEGLVPLPPGKIAGGNLVLGDDCLIVADSHELRVYAPPSRHRPEQEEQARAYPDSPMVRYRLALTEADAGLHDRALENYRLADRFADRLILGQTERLRRLVKQGRHETLLEKARLAQAEKRFEQAAESLKAATATEFPIADRLLALSRLANLWVKAQKPREAVAVWQSILSDDTLRLAGGNEAYYQIRVLISEHGKASYEPIEACARKLIESAVGLRRPEILEQLVAEFPNAVITEAARKELAELRKRPEDINPSPEQLPWRRSWEVTLRPSERLLTSGNEREPTKPASFLLFAEGRQLTCRELSSGKTRWTTLLPFAPTWADGSTVAGPGGIVGIDPFNGRVQWQFHPPFRELETGTENRATFSGFRPCGRFLGFFQGEKRFFLITGDGSIEASLNASGALVHPQGRYSSYFGASALRLVLQDQAGQPHFFSRIYYLQLLLTHSTEPFPPRPLLVLDGDSDTIGKVSSSRTITLYQTAKPILNDDTGPRFVRWTHTIPGDSTRTGEPPWILGGGETLLVLIPRNYGFKMQRLNVYTGASLWDEECLLSNSPVDPDTIAHDETAFYHVANNVLFAHALKDGKRLWERPLAGPPGRWQVRRVGDALLTYPLDARANQYQVRWLGFSVEWQITHPHEDASQRGFPVVVCDPKTGQLIQRLNFTPAGGELTARTAWSGPFTVMPRMRRSRPPVESVAPTVLLTDQGIVVALEGRAWGLRGTNRESEK